MRVVKAMVNIIFGGKDRSIMLDAIGMSRSKKLLSKLRDDR